MNIVRLKEMITYQQDENGEVLPIYTESGLAFGDVFMVFEYVPYDLSGLLKSKEIVSFYESMVDFTVMYICS